MSEYNQQKHRSLYDIPARTPDYPKPDELAMETKVIIDKIVHQKIMHWVNKSYNEVSGLGKVISENGSLRVIDAILLPQKNTGTTTEIEPEEMARAMYLLKDSPGMLNFWWHSHVNMGVFWSGEDRSTIKKLGVGGWFLNTVFNKKKEMLTSLYLKEPVEVFLNHVPTIIEDEIDPAMIVSWDQEYEKNVKTKYEYSPQYHEYSHEYWEKRKQELLDEMDLRDDIPRGEVTDFPGNQSSFALTTEDPLDNSWRRNLPATRRRAGPPTDDDGGTGGVY